MTNIIYPKSKQGYQCISPCYFPGNKIIHPMTMEFVHYDHDPFCLTNLSTYWIKNKEKVHADVCSQPTATSKETGIDMMIPGIELTDEGFLKKYYGINSFDDVFLWINANKTEPTLTKMRLVNCGWVAYGKTTGDVIYDYIIETYQWIIGIIWIDGLCEHFSKYISKKLKKIFTKEITEPSLIRSFLLKYRQRYSSEFEKMGDVNDHILRAFTYYLSKKVYNIKPKN